MSPTKPVDPTKRKRYKGEKISSFSENVRARRLELGLKQSELAATIGTSVSVISNIEGGGSLHDTDRIWQLADALGCTCDELLRPKE